MAELEDTRRKLSEATHEPLSMLSKIIGEEGTSPRAQRGVLPGDLPASQGAKASGTPTCLEDAVCETPLSKPRRGLPAPVSPELSNKLSTEGSRYEICTYGDVMQVVEAKGNATSELREPPQDRARSTPAAWSLSLAPSRWLVCVGLLAYGFFVLPLSSYLTGLSLGLACGFMMGLGVVLMLAPRRLAATRKLAPSPDDSLPTDSSRGQNRMLQGWMNEMHTYDPETYHPSLCNPVFATLESCRLHLAYPRASPSHRVLMDEPACDAMFACTRCFWLTNSKVSLVPAVLAKKRVWNRKYPICIARVEEEVHGEDVRGSEVVEEEGERGVKPQQAEQAGRRTTTLYLFGRTGREKEEWYQHLVLAAWSGPQGRLSRGESRTEECSAESSPQGSTDDLGSMLAQRELTGSVRESLLLDYSSYMAPFIAAESSSLTLSPWPSQPASPTNTLTVTLTNMPSTAWIAQSLQTP